MGINGVTAAGGAQGTQTTGAVQADYAGRKIQNEIQDAQRQKQEYSSKEELPVEEKNRKQKELQREISSLNEQLRQHQAQVRREQQKEALMKELRENSSVSGDEEEKEKISGIQKEDTGLEDIRGAEKKTIGSEEDDKKAKGINTKEEDDKKAEQEKGDNFRKEMQAITSAAAGVAQEKQQNAVVSRMEEGIVILKNEINQDKARGVDTSKKQAELNRQEEKVRQAVEMENVLAPGGNGEQKETPQQQIFASVGIHV